MGKLVRFMLSGDTERAVDADELVEVEQCQNGGTMLWFEQCRFIKTSESFEEVYAKLVRCGRALARQ